MSMDEIVTKRINECLKEADDVIELIKNSGTVLSCTPGIDKVIDDLFYTFKQVIQDSVDGWFQQAQAIIDSIKGEDNAVSQGLRIRSSMPVEEKDFKEGQLRKIVSGKSYLTHFLKAEQSKDELTCAVLSGKNVILTKQQIQNTPKVFISHSSADKEIITLFVERVLQLGLELRHEEIAFTSDERFGVEPGENIAKYIKDNILGASVVLIMLSKSYKASEICLNEMGAAWALGKTCVSVVLPDTNFSELGWLTSLEKAVSITNKDQLSKLCQTLTDHIPSIDLKKVFTGINLKIDEFLLEVEDFKKLTSESRTDRAKGISTPVITGNDPLVLFDAAFSCICLNEGEYVIQLDIRMRSESELSSIKQVCLCNKREFWGSVDKPQTKMVFKTFIPQGVFRLNHNGEDAVRFIKEDYSKHQRSILDLIIDKDHTVSMSFLQYFETIRQCDGNDELQLNQWSLVVQYNVASEISIPLKLIPLDNDHRGMYRDQ